MTAVSTVVDVYQVTNICELAAVIADKQCGRCIIASRFSIPRYYTLVPHH